MNIDLISGVNSGSIGVKKQTKNEDPGLDFKSLFSETLAELKEDYEETGLTPAEQLLKAKGGENALEAKEDLEKSGSALFNDDEEKSSVTISSDVETVERVMPDGTIVTSRYEDGRMVSQEFQKPHLTQKTDYSQPIVKADGEIDYRTVTAPRVNILEGLK